jgi:hypothetical protein
VLLAHAFEQRRYGVHFGIFRIRSLLHQHVHDVLLTDVACLDVLSGKFDGGVLVGAEGAELLLRVGEALGFGRCVAMAARAFWG